ncbi:MAG: hypothetical protein OEV17_00010 [Nitrospira sp.]|nr:hypothetical protein [Nitrospira sp.]
MLLLLVLMLPSVAQAQTTLKVPFDQAVFSWTSPTPGPANSPADKHTIVCGAITVDVPMPTTSKPVSEVVPGVGLYTCSLYASNSFGRQSAPNVPFPTFEAGLIPLAPTNPRLEVLP